MATLSRFGLSCAVIVLGFMTASAGPLAPPPGPVTSTAKPLAEIEPRIAVSAANTPGDVDSVFKLTQPGSYYLTGNVVGEVTKHGIEIAASGVALDLMGFQVRGVATPTPLDGIIVSVSNGNGIVIRNGSITGWTDNGVNAGLASVQIEAITAYGNFGDGIAASIVPALGSASTVVACVARDNAGRGITGGTGCVIRDCAAQDNLGDGIVCGTAGAVLDCSSLGNGSDGIRAGTGSTVGRCTANDNGGVGISAGQASTMQYCTASDNEGNGLSMGPFGSVMNCVSSSSGSHGITTSSNSSVIGCTATLNTGDGIRVGSRSRIEGNTCSINGVDVGDGAGIHVTGGQCLIDGNTVTACDRGIDIDAGSCIVIRNSAFDNLIDYDIVPGNDVGPIGTAATATSPWANLLF